MCKRLLVPIVVCICASTGTSQDEASKPSTAGEYRARAFKHEMAKRYDRAIGDLGKAIELDPKFVGGYFTRSSLYAQKKDYPKAISDLSKALEINPCYYAARFNRGLYHEYVREYDRAIDDYTRALDRETDYSNNVESKEKLQALAYHYRGRAQQWYKKDYAKAVADYTEALRLDPSIRMVRYRRGRAYHAIKKYAEAERDFRSALSRRPKYPNLLASWAWQLSTCPDKNYRDGRKALELAKKANEIFEMRIPWQVDVLAAAYAENGIFDRAAATQKRAIALLKNQNEELRVAMKARLAIYEANRPFRDD